MTATLLKHEVLRTRGFLLTIAGAALGLAAVGSALAVTGWPVLAPFGLVLGAIGAFGLLPAMQLALAVDYWRSGYGRIGYFTQTLPVRGSRIFGARIVWAAVVVLLGLIATLAIWFLVMLAAAVTLFGLTPGTLLQQIGEVLGAAYAAAPWLVAVGAPLTLLLLYGYNTVTYYAAASIGSERWLQRLGWGGPVLTWFVLSTAVQLVLLLGILAIPFGLGVTDAGEFGFVPADLLAAMIADTELQLMPIGFVPALVVVIPLLLWRTAHSWNHRVALA
ncbi:hypothetical protein [Agrococcus baldri]|uniref:Uncharacterized protein n=1 Tax=Agrococcus baldri TaxID=153730 RepID=A0AA87UXI2_9MICO|nr:hypothetical protein [Agrococcus baldri]GEK80432.1 hypothetical protein ABA31_17830 [Agrococcus baldri]